MSAYFIGWARFFSVLTRGHCGVLKLNVARIVMYERADCLFLICVYVVWGA